MHPPFRLRRGGSRLRDGRSETVTGQHLLSLINDILDLSKIERRHSKQPARRSSHERSWSDLRATAPACRKSAAGKGHARIRADMSMLAAQLESSKPRVITVVSAGIAEVVLTHTKTIPVVALQAGQLEAEPSVKSLAKPGGNLTGMQLHSPELIGKRLQLLREVVPDLRRVAVLRGVPFEGPGFMLYRDANDAAAAKLGIRARYLQFEKATDLEGLFEEMARERDQALLVWGNPHLNAYRQQIFDLTLRYRMPTLYDVRGLPEELMVYTASLDDVQREAATYVDRILRGASPADLAIGQAKTYELIVNVRTAKVLGLTIPQSLLLRADEVIQ